MLALSQFAERCVRSGVGDEVDRKMGSAVLGVPDVHLVESLADVAALFTAGDAGGLDDVLRIS